MTTDNDIQFERRQVATFLLTILQGTLKEQHAVKNISKWASNFIYKTVREEAIRQGWI